MSLVRALTLRLVADDLEQRTAVAVARMRRDADDLEDLDEARQLFGPATRLSQPSRPRASLIRRGRPITRSAS